MDASDKIKAIRAKYHLTQRELAKILDVTQGAISAIERGDTATSKLDVKIDSLYRLTTKKYYITPSQGNKVIIKKRKEPRNE